MLRRLALALFSTDEATWLGHALQGFAFALPLTVLGVYVAESFVLGAFIHREVSDLLTPVIKGELTWQQSWRKFRRDGIPDLFSAIIGAHLGIAANLIFL